MKHSSGYTIVYMFVVTAVFSTVLIAFSRFTRDRVEANAQIDFERAVLQAVDVPEADTLPSMQVHDIFVARVRTDDSILPGLLIYEYENEKYYALPFAGQGFWDAIRGVIGIAADKRTIIGFAVYDQNETPGLGALITRPAFRNQFDGRRIAETGRHIVIRTTAEGPPRDENDVAAVTGATQTSTRLEKMMNEQLEKWITAATAAHETSP